jgi:hypothetical protein
MNALIRLGFFALMLVGGGASGQSNLPDCVGPIARWSNCFGKALFTTDDGTKLAGVYHLFEGARFSIYAGNDVIEKYLPGKTKLVFLDACRDNPLMQVASRSVSRGLAPINVSEGTLISYATKDGSVAQDGDGNNSPFTTALLEHLGDPDDIAVVLRKVRDKVMKSTGGKQQPWEHGSLTGGALVLSAIKPK